MRTILLAFLFVGCRCGDPAPAVKPAPSDRPHVVVISLDTTRADFLGPWGRADARTPNLDALAAESVLFERAFSPAPTTLASHTALMTGRYQHNSGVPRNAYEVHADNLFLAEILKDQGYATAAFLGALPLGAHSGFPQGIDHLDDRFDRLRKTGEVDQSQRRGEQVTDATLAWLDAQDTSRAHFLFVHYFDAHAPYDAPEPYGTMFEPDMAFPDVGSIQDTFRIRKQLKRNREGNLDHSESLRRLYQGEIAYTDAQVGRLIDGLRSRGILDHAILILTGDHGEAMDAHWEYWNHGYSIFDETVHVPLLVRLPGGEHGGTRVARTTSTVDVFPTVLEWLGLPVPTQDGETFLPVLRGEPTPARGPVFSEATKPYEPQSDSPWRNDLRWKSIRTDDWELQHHPLDGERHLYDLRADPDELTDLLVDPTPEQAAMADQLFEQLEAWRRSAAPLDSDPVEAGRIRQQLEALGYVENEDD